MRAGGAGRTIVVVALAMAATVATTPANAARDWAVCYGQGPGGVTPGFTMEPRSVEGWVEIRLEPCVSSIATIRSGDLHVTFSSAAATCLQPAVNGTGTIDWNDGNVSEMTWIGDGVTPLGVVHGRIVGGTAFVGNDFDIVFVVSGGNPSACNTAEGITSFEFTELDWTL